MATRIPRPDRFRSYNAAQAWHDAMLALSGKVDVRDKDVPQEPTQEECDIDPDEAVTEYKNRRGE